MAEPIQPGDLIADDSGSRWGRVRLRKIFAWVLLAVIGIVIWRSDIDILDALDRMRRANVWMMAGMIGAFIAARWFGGEILRQTLQVLGHHIEKSEAFYITIVRTYAGLLVPKGGYGAASAYLKVKHGVDFAKSGSLLLPMLLLQCAVIGPMGLMTLAVICWRYEVSADVWWAEDAWLPGPFTWWAGAFFVTTCLGFSVLLVKTSIPTKWNGKIVRFARRVGDSWRQISGNRPLILRLMGIHTLLVMLRALRLLLAFYAVVQDVGFLPILAASLLADIAFIVSPTPNGLGTREATILAFFVTLPAVDSVIDPDKVASAVILDRVVTTLIVIIFAQVGLVRVSNASARQEDDSRIRPGETLDSKAVAETRVEMSRHPSNPDDQNAVDKNGASEQSTSS